jgi:hypothetical protein
MPSHDTENWFIERELEYFRSATAFHELAVIAAMDLCAEEKKGAPAWLVAEAASLLIELVKAQKVTKLGRAGGIIAEYRRHLIDLDRWDAVIQIREIRDKTAHQLRVAREHRELARIKGLQGRVEHFRKVKRWLRSGTHQCAALLVTRNGGARVSAAAIRRSYRRIQQKNATRGFRSCVFMPDFLRKLGLDQTEKPGRKFRPIYDLSP